MFIKSITIENFKVYPGENVIEFKEPNPKSHLNCYVFGGLNGAGKTSLLQALVLGLHGPQSDGIAFERSLSANLKTVYRRFLEESFSHRARAAGETEMRIEIVLLEAKQTIEIKRTWWFKETGEIEDEDLQVLVGGKPLKVDVGEEGRQDVLQEYIEALIPARVAKFFFFDGEEIKSISESDPGAAVIEGLDALLGFNTLGRLDDDLQKILRDIQAQVDDSPSKSSYMHALANKDELDERKQRLEGELADVHRTLADNESETARIDERLNSIFQGSTVQESSELIDRMSAMESEQRALTAEIGRFVGDLLYTALPATLLRTTEKQVAGEAGGRAWTSNKAQFDPQRDRVIERLFGRSAPQPEPKLTAPQKAFLKARLIEEWTEMFNPPPEGLPDAALFEDWPVAAMEDALRQIEEVKLRTRQELVTRIGGRNRLERELQKLRQAHNQFQVGPEAQQSIDRKAELAATAAQLQIQIQDVEREISAVTAEISNVSAQVGKLSEAVSQTEAVRRRYDTARELRDAIREFMDELRQRRVMELSRRMSEMMKKLAHKDDLVSKISIDPSTYVLRILNSKGEEVQAPSAGEREVFALSMLWGLAKISKRNLPVVIDTPLGRLDQTHRASIVGHYFPEAGEQVIILSTDAEIDETWYRKLKPSIVQEFVLEHDDTEEVTTIISDRYFSFAS